MAEEQEIILVNGLKQMPWPINYGTVKIQVRDGKATLVTIEKTIKLD